MPKPPLGFANVDRQTMRELLNYYHNVNWNSAENGEYRIFERLSGENLRTVFDVGANEGQWATMALAKCPDAVIHCFEMVPDTADRLAARFQDCERIVVNRVGLADAATVHAVTFQASRTQTASLLADYPIPASEPVVTAKCRTIRGDQYVRDRDIQGIDFLKLDVEGSEGQVLAGFDDLLRSDFVSVLQFEYSRMNILNGFLLRDICSLLTSRGYRVGKVYPTYVDFRDFSLRDETFRWCNYLAVSASRDDLISTLQ